jgi:hypothetical protein
VIAPVAGGYTIGLYDDGRDGVYRVQGTIIFPNDTDTAVFTFAEAGGNDGLEQSHGTYPDVADRTGNTIDFDLFVNGADDIFTITDEALESEAACEAEVEREASLIITGPDTDGQTLSGEYEFTAEYTDDDDTIDTINWAIKTESCEVNNTGVNVALLPSTS